MHLTRGGAYVEPTVIDTSTVYTDSHSLESYRADLARFLVAEQEGEGNRCAAQFIRSVQGGFFTDAVHDEVIMELLARDNEQTKIFAKRVLDAAESGELKNYSLLQEHFQKLKQSIERPETDLNEPSIAQCQTEHCKIGSGDTVSGDTISGNIAAA